MSEPSPPSSPPRPDGRPADGRPADETTDADAHDDIDDAIITALSDYLDGALSGPARAEIERKIAEDAAWTRAHAALTETRTLMSGLRKAAPPASFVDGVADTIHQRSDGRLFGRRALGDRVPFGVLVAVALAGLAVIAYVLWSSSTGSLKMEPDAPPPRGSAAVVPPP